MEKMLTRFGVTAAQTQRQLHLKRHLDGTLAGDMEEGERETQEAGVNSPVVETGASSTLKKPREAGTHLSPHPRTHKPVLGTEL